MVRILIAEDMTLIRERYERILNEVDNFDVVASVPSGREAVTAYKANQIDIVLMDIEMETKTAGLDAAAEILQFDSTAKIIISTVYEQDELVYEAFTLGVTDYIVKNFSPDRIISCIQNVCSGVSSFEPQIAEKIRREFKRVKISEERFETILELVSKLSQVELEIVDLTSQGYSRIEISRLRQVELSTIKSQINSILRKLDKESMVDVVQMMKDTHLLDYLSTLRKHIE